MIKFIWKEIICPFFDFLMDGLNFIGDLWINFIDKLFCVTESISHENLLHWCYEKDEIFHMVYDKSSYPSLKKYWEIVNDGFTNCNITTNYISDERDKK